MAENPWNECRDAYRGFIIVLEVLVKSTITINQLVIDVNKEETGIPYQFFQSQSEPLTHFMAICCNLRRLDLALNVKEQHDNPGMDVLSSSSSKLREALASATNLEAFSIHTNAWPWDDQYPWDIDVSTDLFRAIPVAQWPSLRSLTLSKVPFKSSEFIGFLKLLPPKIESVQLDDVQFVDKTWKEILPQLKQDLGWRAHAPEVTITKPIDQLNLGFFRAVAKRQIATFFNGGRNPFVGCLPGSYLQFDFADVRDDFNSDVLEPYEPVNKGMHERIEPGYWT